MLLNVHGFFSIFLTGCLGGLIPEGFRLARLLVRSEKFPEYYRNPAYWLITVVIVAISGLMAAVVYPPESSCDSFSQSILVGASVPFTLSALAGVAPVSSGSPVPPEPPRRGGQINFRIRIDRIDWRDFINFLAGR